MTCCSLMGCSAPAASVFTVGAAGLHTHHAGRSVYSAPHAGDSMPAIPGSNSVGHKAIFERASFALGRLQEDTDIEFKRSAPWNTLRMGIVKSSLAMANRSGGGIIVV